MFGGRFVADNDADTTAFAEKYFKTTSIAWLRIGLVRGTQIIYLSIIARLLTLDEMGFVQTIAIGVSFIGGIAVPWLSWVMHQKALTTRDRNNANRIIHQMTIYGVLATFTLAPLLSLLYLFSLGIPFLAVETTIFLLATMSTCLFQIFQGVNLSNLRTERNVFFGAARTVLNYLIPLILYLLTLDVLMILWGWIIADSLTLLFLIPTSGVNLKALPSGLIKPSKDLLIFALPILFIYIFTSYRSFIDRYLVLIFFGTANLATYHLVNRITGISSEAVLTLLTPFLPIITKMMVVRQERVGVAFGATLKMLVHGLVFVSPILAFCGAPIISLILGDQYVSLESVIVLAIASVTMALTAMNTLFLRVLGAKGSNYRMLVFTFSYVGTTSIFLALFYFLGWFGLPGIIAVAICMLLGIFLTFCIIAWQTEELRLVGRNGIIRLLLLLPFQALTTYFLALWLSPIDLLEVFIIAGISFLTLFIFSGLVSSFSNEDLAIISRVSKQRLDPFIRFYNFLGIKRKKTGIELDVEDI